MNTGRPSRRLDPFPKPRHSRPCPSFFRHNGYRFHFFSNEGDPREPVHIHVTRDRSAAKFWFHPASRFFFFFALVQGKPWPFRTGRLRA
ncbi:MAG TPA: DUF4160 domain-containing protein [Sphingomonas sp.]|nr:DUF4160 domain-containing protein [Sphingomonas sp.]